jgi:hypothetical protein
MPSLMNTVSSYSHGGPDGYAAVARQGEVITDSVLSRSSWPERDPTQRAFQQERLHDDETMAIVREASYAGRFTWERFCQQHRDADTAENFSN